MYAAASMDARVDRGRLHLAALAGVVSAGCVIVLVALASDRAGADPLELLPDLITFPIQKNDLVVEKIVKRKLLRLSNEVGNQGSGPLEIRPELGGFCPGGQYDAVQRVFEDSNGTPGFQRGDDDFVDQPPFGCMKFHGAPGHDHWHVLDFAQYELIREHKGTRATARKIGFCVIDTDHAFPTLIGSPADSYYLSGCGGPGVAPTLEGLSVGWADVYFYGLPGQSLKINHIGRGHYCLVSTADPENLILESNEANNEREVRIKLRPRKLKFHRVKGACRT
jgi:Lysyl oxidase